MVDCDERVLQQRALAGVRVNVPGGDGRDSESAGEALSCPVANLVATGVGTLQLDPQALRGEGVQQPPCRRLILDAVFGAASQTDQPFGVLEDQLQWDGWLAGAAVGGVSRTCVRVCE